MGRPRPARGGDTSTSAAEGPLAEFGESTDADPALVEKALGPVDGVPDIVLASIARANQDLDQATIDKALECWAATKCDTGHAAATSSWATPTAAG